MAHNIPFTDEELTLAQSIPSTKEHEFHAYRACTVELGRFLYEEIVPVLSTLIQPNSREIAVATMAYRLCGLVKAAGDLIHPYQFQSVASTARAIYEVCVDLELLCTDKVGNAVNKFHGFTRASRFDAARQMCDFYERNPTLDGPDKAVERKRLAKTPGESEEIEALCQELWKRSRPPLHWSGHNMRAQCVLLGPTWEERHLKLAPLLGWQIHGGAAGVAGLSQEAISAIEVIARQVIKDSVPQSARHIANELHIGQAVPHLFERLEFTCEYVETYAFIDAKLQSAGKPSKFAKTSSAD